MEPRIEAVAEKKLVGMMQTMSLTNNKTGELWKRFIPRRKEIPYTFGSALYSMQVYEPRYFETFNPDNVFEKWAAVEVTDFGAIPNGLETYTVPQGLYAIFHYKGASTDTTIFQYIFNSWLPVSNYFLDNRPHFELLGEKYKNADPNSEEDIYIPIALKK
jgi:AraC family transcriptional regulator